MSKSDEQVSFVILKGTRGTQTVETVNGRSIFTGTRAGALSGLNFFSEAAPGVHYEAAILTYIKPEEA
jgi:hypothetical protein